MVDGVQTTQASRLPIWAWAALAASAVILIAFRLHAFDLPLETDECNYAYIAGRLLAGDQLYLDVWDHQPPGIYVLFAGATALFGSDPYVFRGLAAASSLGSLVFLFLLARRLGGASAAAIAALLFAVASADPGTAGEGCNREIFMNTLILAAWWLAVSAGSQRLPVVAVVGTLLGLASMLKLNVAVHGLMAAAWVAVRAWAGAPPGRRSKPTLLALGSVAIGPMLIWGGITAYFFARGRGREFVDAAFVFNLGYGGVSEGFLGRFFHFFRPHRHPYIFDSALPLWIGVAVAAAWLVLGARRSSVSSVSTAISLLAASYAAVCLPAHFWPHYYYLMVPAMALAVSLVVTAPWPRGAIGRGVRFAFPVVVLVLLAYTQYRDFLSQPAMGITVKRYNTRDFWGRAQGHHVREVTGPEDEIFVFGNDAGIYYYAERQCASRYTMLTGLHQGYPGAEARRETLLKELRSRLPRLVLVLFDEPPFEGWLAFLEEYYGEAVGVDFHDKSRSAIMLVFARKDAPIKRIDWDWDRATMGR